MKSQFHYMDQWLVFLSRNGIRELILKLPPCGGTYKLPSCVCLAPNLEFLKLYECVLNPPTENDVFLKLTTLELHFVRFPSSRLNPILHTPELRFICLKHCSSGFHHFNICAPKLKSLVLECTNKIGFSGLLISRLSRIAFSHLVEEVKHFCSSARIDLRTLFERRSRVLSCYVDGESLQFLGPDTMPERLPTEISCLTHVELQKINLGNLHELSCILCILLSCPMWSRLEISVNVCFGSSTKDALDCMDAAHDGESWPLNNLRTVMVEIFFGSKAELLFIKLLLSRSPVLRKMFIEEKHECWEIAKQLLRFPRASTQAEIMYDPNVKLTPFP